MRESHSTHHLLIAGDAARKAQQQIREALKLIEPTRPQREPFPGEAQDHLYAAMGTIHRILDQLEMAMDATENVVVSRQLFDRLTDALDAYGNTQLQSVADALRNEETDHALIRMVEAMTR